MSNIISFSHWFWITLLTLSFHCNVLLSTNDESVVVLKDSARRESKSIDSSSSYVNVLRAEAEVSTSRSVSVSHVRVEVGREEQYPRLRKIRKPSQKNKRKKMKKSFLENIYSKLKEFARVTLASRRSAARSRAGGSWPSPPQSDSGNTSHEPLHSPQHSQDTPDDVKDPPLNVMSFNEFSDSPVEPVDTNDVSENNKATDIETSSRRSGPGPHTTGNVRPRSEEARGRSLWSGEVGEDGEGPQARFASFTQKKAVLFDPAARRDGGLMAWTNVIILGVSMVTVFAIVSVLVVAVLYRRAKSRATSHCDQFSDILSTSSRSSSSSSSTISSKRSGKSVPDRIDNISFHSEGQLRKSVYTCDDLYSLDSDYFLSSLEDISVQI